MNTGTVLVQHVHHLIL